MATDEPSNLLMTDSVFRLVEHLYKTLWQFILYYLVPMSYSIGQRCFLDTPDLLGISASGDILFGAVLPLHMEKEYPKLFYTEKPKQAICRKLSLETYLQLHMVKYATTEINHNPDLLPNITLGYRLYDSCSVLQRELEGTMWMMTGDTKAIPNFQCRRNEKLAAIIGHSTSTYSILMAHILGLTRYPQISHLSTSSLLSDRTQFPSFFRTVPSDAFQSKGLSQLALHFGWTWVGLVALANDYGQQGIQVIKQEILKSGACVEFTEYIQINRPSSNIPHIGQVIKASTAQAVVIFSTDVHFLPLLNELFRQNVTEKIWLASEGWSTTSLFSLEKYSKLLAGTVGFAFYSRNIPGFQEYVDHLSPSKLPEKPWNWMFWEENIPISVCSEICPLGFRKAPLSRKPTCCYQCIPCALGEITNKTDANECLKCPWDQWPNEQKDKCLPKLTEFLSHEETLGVILMSTSITSSLIPLGVLGLLIHYKATPIVKANNYTVSCLLLASMSLCFLSSLAFIGYPNNIKCLLRQVTFGMAFALCVSCVLAKTVMVLIAFKATKPNSCLTKWARPQVSYLMIVLGTFLQLLISVTWLLITPPFPQYNLNAKSGVIIAECNEGSLAGFWCTTGYLGILALASFLVAFLTRQLPSRYNEARFITFSMLAFLSVWVSYIPASLSTSGKYTVAMEIFAILSSNWAMLCCMFAPKCYIIMFQPSMNSRKHLLGNK
ncbi:uncharacterized protein LOC122925491 [Bufo gargarizans]|uniref:uncharacterized protein LOC122925491 n=1 Tax=Bufo gargarizans TaxID=30331 RepID=UPI001CF3554D|nr:uncharacterized protein LOC122925491 [Bufo gargarizans]